MVAPSTIGRLVSHREAPATIEANEGVPARRFTERGAFEQKMARLLHALIERDRRLAVELQREVQGHHVKALVDEVEERVEFEGLHSERLPSPRRRIVYQCPIEPTILVVDNYDSFVYNLVQYLGELGATVIVRRNDDVGARDMGGARGQRRLDLAGTRVIRETRATASSSCATAQSTRLPMLGVCLGHQAIAEAFGGDVAVAPELLHGRASLVTHDDTGVFRGRVESSRRRPIPLARGARREAAERVRSDGALERPHHGDAPSRRSISRACSFTPSRSSPKTGT